MHAIKSIIIALLFITLSACGPGDYSKTAAPPVLNINFVGAPAGWTGGFADYTISATPNDVVTQQQSLPTPYSGQGMYVFGTNRSDDLFIYVKAKVAGFVANQHYALHFQVSFLSNASSGCLGVGGSPGESVYVKAGASTVEPMSVQIGDYVQMNIDKGNQSASGANALTLGNLSMSDTTCSGAVYEEKTLVSSTPLAVTADKDGAIWLLLGIDSAYEAASNLYFTSLQVTSAIQADN